MHCGVGMQISKTNSDTLAIYLYFRHFLPDFRNTQRSPRDDFADKHKRRNTVSLSEESWENAQPISRIAFSNLPFDRACSEMTCESFDS